MPRDARGLIVAPGESRIDHRAFGYRAGIIAAIEREVRVRASDVEAEMRVRPSPLAHDGLGVGVEQQLVGVEAAPAVRIIGTVDTVTVKEPRTRLRQIGMPDVIGLLLNVEPCHLVRTSWIEETQLDSLGMLGEEREIDSSPIPGGA